MLAGILVIALFITINCQNIVNCTGYVPPADAPSQPTIAKDDIDNFINFSKVILDPNSTLTKAQIKVMVDNFVPTMSCATQLAIEKWKINMTNLSPAAQALYLQIKPIKDNGILTYAQAHEQISNVLKDADNKTAEELQSQYNVYAPFD
uniref:DUF148 domain-containing protein n=1 Tax=Panagrellus redivivus TaxID=6233 RepID=A0A7E4UY94_PANRE